MSERAFDAPLNHGRRQSVSRPLLALATCVTIALAPVVAEGGERIGDVDVSIQPLPTMDSGSGIARGTSHGYVEFRVKLKNLSQENRVVRLAIPPTRDGVVDHGVMLRRTVQVAGGQEAWVSLFQPPTQLAVETLEVSVQGVPDPLRLSTRSSYEGIDHRSSVLAVLLSRDVPREFRELGGPGAEGGADSGPEPARPKPAGRSTSHDPFTFFRSEMAVSQWSPNWLGYSCYDAIVVTEKEVEEMTPRVRLALRRYLECGGTVLVHGRTVPAAFSRGGGPAGQGTYRVGFGCAAASLASGSNWKTTYTKLADLRIPNYRPDTKPNNLYELLVAEATVPVRGLFLLVLLFGLVIGPANLWVLSRIKRRIWLWWNVPVISLATCLIVFVYSMASEGITGHGKTASLTLLDERCHRATTIGYLSYYCPLSPSAGPRFGVDTDVAILSRQESIRFRPDLDDLRVVDWTRDQHLSSGWVKARVPTYFQIRKNEDRRERLTVEQRADGSLKVVNALGADIQRLYVADRSGNIFVARGIPAGAEATAEAVPHPAVSESHHTSVRDIFRDTHWLDDFKQLGKEDIPRGMLSPGCYIAYLDNSPFIESALAEVRAEDSIAIVYGISKEQDDGR
ncbi:MAG: hypothetical protein R6U98_33275 [Pirellulaceae bacterium]